MHQGFLVAVTIATHFSTPNCGIARGDRGLLAYVNGSVVTATKIVRCWFRIFYEQRRVEYVKPTSNYYAIVIHACVRMISYINLDYPFPLAVWYIFTLL